jgi:RNA polymerase sigma-70 factor (ECF subfamily)
MDNKNELVAQWPALKQRVEGYVFSVVKDADTTNDILQEVFIKAYTRISTLKDAGKLQQWLFSIARNEINTHFNTQKKQQQIPTYIQEDEAVLFNSDFENCIEQFIGALPQKYGVAVQLAEIENLSQHELAKRLNISYSGAKSRVQRGRVKLKELLTQCCHIAHDKYGNVLDYEPRRGGYCSQYCG